MLFTSKPALCSLQHKGFVCRRPHADNRKMATRLHSTLHVILLFPLAQHNFKTRKHRQWAAVLPKIYGGWSKQDCEGKGSCYVNCWLLQHTKNMSKTEFFIVNDKEPRRYDEDSTAGGPCLPCHTRVTCPETSTLWSIWIPCLEFALKEMQNLLQSKTILNRFGVH